MILPVELRNAIATLAGNGDTEALRKAHADVSNGYRQGLASSALIETPAAVAAYAAARMPATFAAVSAALKQLLLACPEYAPKTLLDIGCGPGTAIFAALEACPELRMAHGIDHNQAFLHAARRLAENMGANTDRSLDFTQADVSQANLSPADLVIASYALVELPRQQAMALAIRAWQATRQTLLLVEPGTPVGFECLRAVRSALIETGAVILAPCPHDQACPMEEPDWCHFSIRLPRSRIHKTIKNAEVPFEDEKFSYLIAARTGAPHCSARIIAPVTHGKAGHSCRICSASGVETRRVAPRDPAFKAAKKWSWGEGIE